MNFPVYQIDFAVMAAGKRVASTKRRIRWRFGFPSQDGLEQGKTGTDCRGEEHEVTVVWSITSGKRQITMDNKEMHYSSNRAGILDFTWTTRGNHVIKVVCHASPPLSAVPGFHQYDLFVDGQSYFTMPKVYELGLKGPKGRGGGRRIKAPTNKTHEEEELQRAIQASLEESRAHLDSRRQDETRSAYTPSAGENLLDFAAPPAPAPQPTTDSRSVASFYSAPPPQSSYAPAPYQARYPTTPQPTSTVGPGAIVPAVAPPGYYGAPAAPAYAAAPAFASAPVPAPAQQYAAYAPAPIPPAASVPGNLMNQPPAQPNDVFGLNSGPGNDPFAPKAPDLTELVMNAYTPGAPVGISPSNAQSPQTSQANGGYAAQNGAVPLTMQALPHEDDVPINDFDAAIQKLVNVDRIDEPVHKLTMMKEEEKKSKTPTGKSVPIPPVGSGIVGSNASLTQISTVKSNAPPKSEGIMNAPPPGVFQPGAAAHGALVVHGQGPPPLHQQGFGLGAQMPNGGFGAPHQQQQYQQPRY